MDNQEIIKSMIEKIFQGDNVGAQEDFDTAISSKLTSALDDKKLELAQNVYTSQVEIEKPAEEEVQDEDI